MSAELSDAPIRLLRTLLALCVDEYWRSRDIAFEFLLLLPHHVVDEVWREFWGRGLFDED